LKRSQEAISLAQKLAHPFSFGTARIFVPVLYQFRQEWKIVRKMAEEGIAFTTERGFTSLLPWGTAFRGWALAEQGQREEGIAQIRQGMAAWRATGAEVGCTHFLALLAEAHGKGGQVKDGITALSEAFALVKETGECFYQAELYRLYGELSLRAGETANERTGKKSEVAPSPDLPVTLSSPETCFLKAIDIAHRQQAKSWELRASTSLARLWQSQGKRAEAHKLLSDVYNWFTEGFDTKDLQEAKALLEELRH
jgi:predicted ATPase